MIIVYAECKSKPGCESQMLEAAKGMLEPTRAEKGCISYELIQSESDPSVYAFLEKWESQEILDMHMKTEHFTTLIPKMEAVSESGLVVNVFKPLA